MKMKYIKWLDELDLRDIPLVGGKTASIGEMYKNLKSKGIAVPFGFAITAEAYWRFMDSIGLREELKNFLTAHKLEKEVLIKKGQQLREQIRQSQLPSDMEEEIGLAYQKIKELFGADISLAVRSSATAEDLPTASFAGQQESYLHIRSQSELMEKCVECFASLFTDRSVSYRQDQHIKENGLALSICVQLMIRSDLASSGVAFTVDTESGFKDAVVINAAWGLGENIVKGVVNPDEYIVHKPTLQKGFRPVIGKKIGWKEFKLVYNPSGASAVINLPTTANEQKTACLSDNEILHLAKMALDIEEYYTHLNGYYSPMDIEWAKDGPSGVIYILQARLETVHSQFKGNEKEEYILKEKGVEILKGESIGQKIGQGKVKIIKSLEDLHAFHQGDVLVAEKTEPDWEPFLKKASAIITDRGGRTCHAAIVSRELNIPAIVGTVTATQLLKNEEEVTVACHQGREGIVYKGLLPFEIKKISLELHQRPKTKIMMNVANPDMAFQDSLIPNDGVGLLRMEFIIGSLIKIHPLALIHFIGLKDESLKIKIEELTQEAPDKEDYFVDTLARGIAMITAAFYPKEVIVRLSDFKTDEYRHLLGGESFEPEEDNPMIGLRGASRYYDPQFRQAFELECRAIKMVREKMGLTNLKLMVPFCRTLGEAKKVISELKLNGLSRKDTDLELYMMCEIPSNALLAEEFAHLFDGFSIGSNDLTQLALGVDRNNEKLANLFSENDPAVLKLIEMAIAGAHKKGKKIGLCGQRPSDDASFAKFLVSQHIDSISINPDAVLKVSESVLEFEQEENLMDKVRDIMTKNPVYCLPDANLEFAAKQMLEHDCGEIPVVDNERDLNPIGVITDRDICCRTVAIGKNPLELKVRDFMTSPAKFISVDTTVKSCCELMEANKIRRVPVVDHNGRICGMVSVADIANKLDESLTSEVVKKVSIPGKERAA